MIEVQEMSNLEIDDVLAVNLPIHVRDFAQCEVLRTAFIVVLTINAARHVFCQFRSKGDAFSPE